ncbi:hypothetical protein, partial [Enterobacter cloacae]|uniref:hypothetical protein n=1 Tax=Enterobacter cloacae TaxID=550 RepID=UPI002147212F
PSLMASSLTPLPFGLRWLASFRSQRCASYTSLQVGIVPGFGLDVSQAHAHYAHGVIHLCAVRGITI